MFRIQDNVPEVYINESRDFQLISRLYDVIFAGVKYNIDSLRHTSNTSEINAQLLPLLSYKLGFFTKLNIDSEQLRHILHIFPSVIHKKGTLNAIRETLNLWFRLNNLPSRRIGIHKDSNNHCITVDIESDAFDTTVLDEIFKYILVAGYYIRYNFVAHEDVHSDYVATSEVNIVEKDTEQNSKLQNYTSTPVNVSADDTYAHAGFTRTYKADTSDKSEEEGDQDE